MYKSKVIAVGMSTMMFLVLSSCTHSPTSANLSANLLQNSSFEVSGQPSLEHWVCDTSLATLVKTGPNGDSTWSMQLQLGQMPHEGFASTSIPAEAGSGTYTLTAWFKSNNGLIGTLAINTWSSQIGGWSAVKSVTGDQTHWSMLSLSVNLSLSASDSIMVVLLTGEVLDTTSIPNAKVLFTDISLQKVQ